MKKPHVHAELIKAWADGAEIQLLDSFGTWINSQDNRPVWNTDTVYRIKPEPTDLEIYGVEVGDIWKFLLAGTVITVRYVRSNNIMTLYGIDYNFSSLSVLLFRRGVVDKL